MDANKRKLLSIDSDDYRNIESLINNYKKNKMEKEEIYNEIENETLALKMELDYYKSMYELQYEHFGQIRTIIDIKKKYKNKEFIKQILKPLGKLLKDGVTIIGNKKYKTTSIENGSCIFPAYKTCDGSMGCYGPGGSCCSKEDKYVQNFTIDNILHGYELTTYCKLDIVNNSLHIKYDDGHSPDRKRIVKPFIITLEEYTIP